MNSKLLLEYSSFACVGLILINLCLIWNKGLFKTYWSIGVLLLLGLASNTVSIPLLFFRRSIGLSLTTSYAIYFYSEMVVAAAETAMMIAIIYNVFDLAMRPMPGIQRLGKIIFRWVAVVSTLLAVVTASGPHMLGTGTPIQVAFLSSIERVQEGTNVLILCLVLFVSFATKPLGMTFRSHTFGVTLGLGIMSAVQLVQAAWIPTSQARSVYSPVYLISILSSCVAFLVWGAYFAVPEPERKMILLPTTSPWFFWNRISEALGDSPGSVVVGGFKPSMLAPAELKVMTEMSKAKQRASDAASVAAEEPVALTR